MRRRAYFLIIGILLVAWVCLFWYLRAPSFSVETLSLGAVDVDAAALEKHVHFLSELNPARSFDNADSTFAAEKYISDELKSMGYHVRLQEVPVPEHTYHNIIVRYGPRSTQTPLIVIGAHYDVADHLPGADDNASGVAGVLELARLFQEKQPEPAVPIEFVFYALEEPPYFGSDDMGSVIHADALKAEGVDVRLMISVEMIGYYSDELFSQKFPFPLLYAIYPWRGNFIAAVARPADRSMVQKFKSGFVALSDTPIYSINAPSFIPGIDYSDHRSYWRHEWPAIMITDTSFYRNLSYHRSTDTADRLNYSKMKEVVEGLYSAAALFAQ